MSRLLPLDVLAPVRPSRAARPIPLRVRQAVAARSGGLCELGCGQRSVAVHHRKKRSQGGLHELPNLLALCLAHHDESHANRDGQSYVNGWLVYRGVDPADVPVVTP